MSEAVITPVEEKEPVTKKQSKYERPEQMLQRFNLALTNAKNDAIQEKLATYRYDTARLDQGLLKLQNVTMLMAAQRKEKGEQLDASARLDALFSDVRDKFITTRTISREVFSNDPNAFTALELSGRTKTSISGLTKQANAFYTNLIGNEQFMTIIANFGYTSEKLNAELTLIKDLLAADALHKKELGEAIEATSERDYAFEKLEDFMSQFYVVASVALKKYPDLLRMIGM